MRVVEFNPITGNRLFDPESEQESAAREQMGQLKGFTSDLQSGKYDVNNPFNNYQDPFGYDDISKSLDDIFGKSEEKINRNTADDILTQQQGAAGSLASRGITGGSILSDTQTGIASKLNKGKYNALADLGIGKSQGTMSLKDMFNRNKFNTTQAGVNVDLSNKRNVLGGLQNSYGQQQGLLGSYDDSTWLDDLFSGLGLAAKVGGIGMSGGSSILGSLLGGSGAAGAGAAAAISDRRLKHNIVNTGSKNGINIYEFSYLGSNKRYSGVIAQEVPFAVKEMCGIQFVDYSLLPGIEFSEV